jgi:type III pantothenate kinase
MKPDVVVDVGNTSIKWGRCDGDAVVEAVSLSHDDRETWARQADEWGMLSPHVWAVTGVAPARRRLLADWLRDLGHCVQLITDPTELPLFVSLDRPDLVGIDRLLDAVAVNSERAAGRPAVIIDAGSAVTIDYLNKLGAFQGGVILPGLRLMARSLKDYTALLPLVEPPSYVPTVPAKNTTAAIEGGIFWAVVGAVRVLVERYAEQATTPPEVFLTGGDGPLLMEGLRGVVHHLWPQMTLEGIRLSAEALP